VAALDGLELNGDADHGCQLAGGSVASESCARFPVECLPAQAAWLAACRRRLEKPRFQFRPLPPELVPGEGIVLARLLPPAPQPLHALSPFQLVVGIGLLERLRWDMETHGATGYTRIELRYFRSVKIRSFRVICVPFWPEQTVSTPEYSAMIGT